MITMTPKEYDDLICEDCLRLAEEECACYDDGMCLVTDCPCEQCLFNHRYSIADGAINCDYFLTHVLPGDEDLYTMILQLIESEQDLRAREEQKRIIEEHIRKCVDCGAYFAPICNRQKRCKACSVNAHRKNDADWHRSRYWGIS